MIITSLTAKLTLAFLVVVGAFQPSKTSVQIVQYAAPQILSVTNGNYQSASALTDPLVVHERNATLGVYNPNPQVGVVIAYVDSMECGRVATKGRGECSLPIYVRHPPGNREVTVMFLSNDNAKSFGPPSRPLKIDFEFVSGRNFGVGVAY